MITVTRLNGAAFAINEDLIERIAEQPDTTLFLVDGTSHIVTEPMTLVIEKITNARADIIARASLRLDDINTGPRLVAVTDDPTPPRPSRSAP
jgi:flagellar protein FlbD